MIVAESAHDSVTPLRSALEIHSTHDKHITIIPLIVMKYYGFRCNYVARE